MVTDPALLKLIAESVERVKRMSPEELEAMLAEQRKSWMRGEMAMGETARVALPNKES